MHPAFFVNLLIGTHRFGVTNDVVDGRHAALEALVEGEDDAVLELEIIELRRDLLENQLRPLVQLAGRLPVSGSCLIWPPAGSGVSRVIFAAAKARLLPTVMCAPKEIDTG